MEYSKHSNPYSGRYAYEGDVIVNRGYKLRQDLRARMYLAVTKDKLDLELAKALRTLVDNNPEAVAKVLDALHIENTGVPGR